MAAFDSTVYEFFDIHVQILLKITFCMFLAIMSWYERDELEHFECVQ